MLVVGLTRYRKRKSGRYYYRQPAYLLTTVLHDTARQWLQIYFDRWQIEVNHREEKDTIGVGQAQLHNVTSVPKQPAFAVASYSALLLASLQAFGAEQGQALRRSPQVAPVRISALRPRSHRSTAQGNDRSAGCRRASGPPSDRSDTHRRRCRLKTVQTPVTSCAKPAWRNWCNLL